MSFFYFYAFNLFAPFFYGINLVVEHLPQPIGRYLRLGLSAANLA